MDYKLTKPLKYGQTKKNQKAISNIIKGKENLAKMIVDKVSRTPRATQMNFSKYKNISKQIGWIK